MTRRAADGDALLQVLRAAPELEPGGRWLVGVSGGADSTALLHALSCIRRSLRLRLVVVHLHHQLRGRSADGDARFVTALARRLRIPCVVERQDVAALAAARGWSMEQAAREARLDFFQRVAVRRGACGVLLAHTRDDQAETLLIRLLRGAGAQGLAGMRAASRVRGLLLVRPLLGVPRAGLRSYLRGAGQAWREDASNADERFLRNAVRHRVLPLLEEVSGRRLAAPLARAAGLLADEEDCWSMFVAEAARRCGPAAGWNVDAVRREPLALQRRLLLAGLWSVTGGGDFETVERVRALLAVTQGQVDVGGGGRAVRVGAELRLEKVAVADALPEVALVVGREITSEAWSLAVRCRRVRGTVASVRGAVGALPAMVVLDAARAKAARLAIRPWRAGDRMRPAGGRGTRKLQDLFADAKLPRAERHRIPVLVADDQPIWLPGFRVAEGWGVAGVGGSALEVVIRRLI